MAQLFKNNAKSTLAASLAAAGTTLTVQTTHGARFPVITGADFFMATLQDSTNIEIVKVTARTADVFTIVRAQEGTTAPATFASGAIISLRMTAAAVESMLNHPGVATAAHAATAISNTATATVVATTVQAAIAELDTKKTTQAAADASATTISNTAVSNHVALSDPHTQYALDTDLTAGLATKQAADATLVGLAALAIALNDIPVGSGADTFGKKTFNPSTALGTSDTVVPSEGVVKTYADSKNISTQVAPSTSGNVLTSNGTAWVSGSSPLGVGQTWQDVFASRAIGTTYTNSTGKPIQVSIWYSLVGAATDLTFTISGVIVSKGGNNANGVGINWNNMHVIPNGGTYVVTGTGTLGGWSELR